MSTTPTPPLSTTQTRVRDALSRTDGHSAAQIATARHLGRSTVTHALAHLEHLGLAHRVHQPRTDGHRLPDLWYAGPKAAPPPAPAAAPPTAAPAGTPRVSHPTQRLQPGQLRDLVHQHLRTWPDSHLGPGDIAKALGRSAGAVANALTTLTARGHARQTHDKPARYQLNPDKQ